jgi:hypothetical protein
MQYCDADRKWNSRLIFTSVVLISVLYKNGSTDYGADDLLIMHTDIQSRCILRIC